MRRLTCVSALTLFAVFALTSLAFNLTRDKSDAAYAAAGKPSARTARREGGPPETPPRVSRARFGPMLRETVRVLGDRLEKPGKERLTLAAALTLGGERQTPVTLFHEFPDKLRVEQGGGPGGPARVLVFDGRRASASDAELARREAEMLETLVHDSAEHFFSLLSAGGLSRHLGSGFRLGAGEAGGEPSNAYDIYQVVDWVKGEGGARRQPKLFYFNSETLLLERVRYEVERDGAPVRVEVQLGDWRETQGQRVPGRVVRFENGEPVMTLAVRSAAVGPRADDGAFAHPQGR